MDIVCTPFVSDEENSASEVKVLLSRNNFIIAVKLDDMPGICARPALTKSNDAAAKTNGRNKRNFFIESQTG